MNTRDQGLPDGGHGERLSSASGATDAAADSTDALARLLGEAGLRPEIDALRRARVERAVRTAWQAGLRRRRRQRWSIALASCAALLLLAVGVRSLLPAVTPVDVAVVVHIDGTVVADGTGGRRSLRVGDRLDAGTSIDTGVDGRLALSLTRIDSVRVDHGTRLTLADRGALQLHAGAVYLDSGRGVGGIAVHTPLLQARDIGTRFMVRHAPGGESDVAVRDGEVQVGDGGARRVLTDGERLQLAADGHSRRSRLPPHDPAWQWARAAAIPFAADGRPLRELLQWYAHESGLRLQIDPSPRLHSRLDAALQGDLQGLDADELLQVAAAAAPVTLDVDRRNGVVHVSP